MRAERGTPRQCLLLPEERSDATLVSIGFALILLLAIGLPSPAHSSLEMDVDACIAPFVDRGMFNGSVLIAKGGQVVLSKGYGMANYELGVPNQPDTRFRVASVSKAFTDIAIDKLIKSGQLSWKTSISEFLPDFPKGDQVTIELLAWHKSGIAHINRLDWYEEASRFPMPLDVLVARIAEAPYEFEPGEKSSYSNGGYVLLAYIVEQVSGLSYGEYLRTAVFDEFSMHGTGHEESAMLVENRASGYVPGHDGRRPAPFVDPSVKIGGGSIFSTVEDLHHWFVGMKEGRVISLAEFSEMYPPRANALVDGRESIQIGGRAPGYVANVQYYPIEEVFIAFLSNNYARVNEEIAGNLARIAFDLPARPFPDLNAVKLTSDQLKRFEGRYRNRYGEFEIHATGGRLEYFYPKRQTRYPLIPISDTELFGSIFWMRMIFEPNEVGEFSSCEIRWLDFPDKPVPVEILETPTLANHTGDN